MSTQTRDGVVGSIIVGVILGLLLGAWLSHPLVGVMIGGVSLSLVAYLFHSRADRREAAARSRSVGLLAGGVVLLFVAIVAVRLWRSVDWPNPYDTPS